MEMDLLVIKRGSYPDEFARELIACVIRGK